MIQTNKYTSDLASHMGKTQFGFYIYMRDGISTYLSMDLILVNLKKNTNPLYWKVLKLAKVRNQYHTSFSMGLRCSLMRPFTIRVCFLSIALILFSTLLFGTHLKVRKKKSIINIK
jgi:hypothetical protein